MSIGVPFYEETVTSMARVDARLEQKENADESAESDGNRGTTVRTGVMKQKEKKRKKRCKNHKVKRTKGGKALNSPTPIGP